MVWPVVYFYMYYMCKTGSWIGLQHSFDDFCIQFHLLVCNPIEIYFWSSFWILFLETLEWSRHPQSRWITSPTKKPRLFFRSECISAFEWLYILAVHIGCKSFKSYVCILIRLELGGVHKLRWQDFAPCCHLWRNFVLKK